MSAALSGPRYVIAASTIVGNVSTYVAALGFRFQEIPITVKMRC